MPTPNIQFGASCFAFGIALAFGACAVMVENASHLPAAALTAALAGGILLAASRKRSPKHSTNDESKWAPVEGDSRFRWIAGQVPVALLVARRRDGRYLFANEAAGKLLGMSAERLIGRSAREFYLNPEDRNTVLAELERSGIIEGMEIHFKRADDRPFWGVLNTVRTTFEGEDAVITGITDISAIKALETELRRARDDADQASRAKSDFLSLMSHELRTPMTAILGYVELLAAGVGGSLSDKQTDFVKQLEKAGLHLLDLINNILDLARIEAGKTSLAIAPLQAQPVIEECVVMVTAAAEERKIEIANPSRDRRLPEILADATAFRQIALNLLSNAVKYNRDGGRVIVDAESTLDGRLRVSVWDTGPGIPLERQRLLFEPFERIDQDRRNIQGTGIGLTITKKLVENMKGQIGFHSTPGVGSLFWVELPLAHAKTETKADPKVVDLAVARAKCGPATRREHTG